MMLGTTNIKLCVPYWFLFCLLSARFLAVKFVTSLQFRCSTESAWCNPFGLWSNFFFSLFLSFSLSPMPPPVLMNFVVFPPGCGYSVADFWGRLAYEARLRFPDEVSVDMYEDEVPGWALKSKSTNYLYHGHHGNLPLPGKIPMVEPGIKPGTSWLVVRNLDHQTTRLVLWSKLLMFISIFHFHEKVRRS